VNPKPSTRACRARPSRGMSQGEVALRGRAGDSAEGVFLGGARSPRPQIRAWRKPRQVMITDGRARGRWPREDNTWVGVVPSLRACGARPSAGGQPGSDGLAEEGPGMARKAFFSEGRGLRVRRVRPHECRGLSFPIHALTMVRWPRGDMPRSNRSLPCGRAEPAPPRPGSATGRTGGPKRGRAPVRRDADVAGVRGPPLRETGPLQGERAASKARCLGKASPRRCMGVRSLLLHGD